MKPSDIQIRARFNQRGIFVANRRRPASLNRRGLAFTLVELLVVIGIIALLASILFPVIGRVREAARETDTKALITSIEAACQSYKQDFNAYPGPLSDAYLAADDQTQVSAKPSNWRSGDSGIGTRITNPGTGVATISSNGFNDGQVDAQGNVTSDNRVTEAENLVLGLLGGVSVNRTTLQQYYLEYDPSTVGQGPASLNPVKPGRSGAYMQIASLSPGKFVEQDGTDRKLAKDSIIPEFVDRWPSSMPILVLRARVAGHGSSATPYDYKNNDVVVNLPSSDSNAAYGQYNLVQITPYTQFPIGGPGNLKQTAYVPTFDPKKPHGLTGNDMTPKMTVLDPKVEYPFTDALTYLADPTTIDATLTGSPRLLKMRARKTDTIILISAGKDRIYGTADDVTNFGSVMP